MRVYSCDSTNMEIPTMHRTDYRIRVRCKIPTETCCRIVKLPIWSTGPGKTKRLFIGPYAQMYSPRHKPLRTQWLPTSSMGENSKKKTWVRRYWENRSRKCKIYSAFILTDIFIVLIIIPIGIIRAVNHQTVVSVFVPLILPSNASAWLPLYSVYLPSISFLIVDCLYIHPWNLSC